MTELFESSNLKGYVNSLGSLIDRSLARELEQLLNDLPAGLLHGVEYQIINGLDAIYENPEIPSMVTDLANMAVFGRTVMHPQSKRIELEPLISGMKKTLGDSNRDYREAPEFIRDIATALVTVAARLDDEYVDEGFTGAVQIKSDSLRLLVRRRPKDAEVIARVVNEHGSTDFELISAMLDHSEQALRGGLL